MESFVKLVDLLPSTTVTSATTIVGEWFEADAFNELIAALNVTAFASRVDETLTVTIERWSPKTSGWTTIMSFAVINTTGAQEEEKTLGTFLGGRIRARAVTAGTWSAKSITFNVRALLKSA